MPAAKVKHRAAPNAKRGGKASSSGRREAKKAKRTAIQINGLSPENENDGALRSLTTKSNWEKARFCLQKLGKRVVENNYVPGHCFFEAVAQSSSLLNEASAKEGAGIVRALLASAYRDRDITANLRKIMGHEMRIKVPGFSSEIALFEDRAAGVAGSELLRSESYHWHPNWFKARAIMMETIDCSRPTADLWEYNVDVDSHALCMLLSGPLLRIATVLPSF